MLSWAFRVFTHVCVSLVSSRQYSFDVPMARRCLVLKVPLQSFRELSRLLFTGFNTVMYSLMNSKIEYGLERT